MPPVLTLEIARERGAAVGFVLKSDEYVNNHTKMKWLCSRGHEVFVSLHCVGDCMECMGIESAERRRLSTEDFHETAAARGGKFLRLEGDHKWPSRMVGVWECAVGHQFRLKIDYVRHQNGWCLRCLKTGKGKLDAVGAKFNLRCLDSEYFTYLTEYTWQCHKCEYTWKATTKHVGKGGRGCPECAKIRAREGCIARGKIRRRNPGFSPQERSKDTNLRAVHGITLEIYRSMEKAQGAVCAICHLPAPGGKGPYSCLNVDHDHSSGLVRDLLCAYCNAALGSFQDSPEILDAGVFYLHNPQKLITRIERPRYGKLNKKQVVRSNYLSDAKYKKQRSLLRGYDITLEQYEKLLESQGRSCAICRCSEEKNGKIMAVDHCHDSGALRGILCVECNLGIGGFKNSPELLETAAAYLRRHAAVRVFPSNDNGEDCPKEESAA